MRVIAISGSPRVGGNTDTALNMVLEAAKEGGAEVELIRLADYELRPCDACGSCSKTRNCIIDDDGEKIYQMIMASDGVIIGSPSYFQGITAQMKTFIDRIGYLALARGRKDFMGKVGGVVGVARRSGLANTCSQMLMWVTAMRMIVPSGGRVFVVARDKGEAMNDKEGIETAQYLGRMIIETIRATENLRKAAPSS
jgi:multimeric flavodoxin WrbA